MRLYHLRATWLAALTLGAGGCIDGKNDDSADDSASDDSGTDDTGQPSACEGGVSLLDAFGNPSGFEECPDGAIHRAEILSTSAENSAQRCAGTESYTSCTTDSECTEHPNGACITGVNEEANDTYCGCVYSCASDADCDSGQFCAPAGLGSPSITWSTCAPADCSSDADCASGECGLSVWNDGCFDNVNLLCRTEADGCRVDGDCASTEQCGVLDGAWDCQTTNCAIGRPLSCEGEARKAPLARVAGWSEAITLRLPEDAARRERLAQRWADIAAMEHASVASFARFTLELMALGAPAELLFATQQAAADEVRHAQLGYGIASALAGQTLGPGPLSLQGIAPATERRAFARALLTEACVGESLGAAEAMEAAAGCADPGLRRALEAVAADEARHAALAWRALGWVLQGSDAALRAELRADAEAAIAALTRVPELEHTPELGLLGGAETRSSRERAARQVLRPLLDAALA